MICESLLSREKSAWAVMWSVLIVHSPWFPGSANNYKVSKEYMNVVRLSSKVLFLTSNQQMAAKHGRQRRSVLVSALITSYLTAMAVYFSNLCLKCYEDEECVKLASLTERACLITAGCIGRDGSVVWCSGYVSLPLVQPRSVWRPHRIVSWYVV